MAIKVNCPHCKHPHVFEKRPAESLGECTNCGRSFRIRSTPSSSKSGIASSVSSHPDSPKPPSASAAEPMALGAQFAGRYTIFKRLGRGGFGTVYHAYDEQESRDVAIKVPHDHVVNDPKDGVHFISRFRHEVEALKGMQHSAIVRFYDAELDRLPIYLVTEFIDGPNIRQWIDDHQIRGASIDRSTVIRRIITLASALDHAHGRGVIHRDVKPENIMLRGDEVVLTDFGLARLTDSHLTEAFDRLGTKNYMSPEQIGGDNQNVDGRSDQYSLGVVLYELLADQVPFPDNPLRKQIEDAPPLTKLAPGIPNDLARVCQRALARVPGQRYPSCRKFADELRALLPASETFAYDQDRRPRDSIGPVAGQGGAGISVPPPEPRTPLHRVAFDFTSQYLAALFGLVSTLLDVSLVRSTRRMLGLFFQAKVIELTEIVDNKVKDLERQTQVDRAEPEEEPESAESGLDPSGLPSSFNRPSSDLARSIGGVANVSQGGSTKTATPSVSSVTRHSPTRELEVTALALSPDGLRVATGGARIIRIKDVEGDRSPIELPLQSQRVQWLAFAPDGRSLAVVIGRSVQVWDVADGQEVRMRNTRLYDVPSERAAFAPDGVHLAAAVGDGSVRLRDAEGDFDVQTLTANPGRRPVVPARALAFHPDRRRLAAGYADGTVVLWDWTTGVEVSRLNKAHDHAIADVAFNRSGTMLVTSSSSESALKFWDAETLHRLNAVPAHPKGVLAMAFHPRRNFVVSASYDGALLVSTARYRGEDPDSIPQLGKKRLELPLGVATGGGLSFDEEGKLAYILASTGAVQFVDLSNI